MMKCLDQLQTGRGPATLKTIGCTMAVILLSSVANILRIQIRTAKLGTVTPMDQVLWRTHLLEASLIGYSLFLGFFIDCMHHYLQRLMNLSSLVGAAEEEAERLPRKQSHLQEKEGKASRELKSMWEEVSTFTECLKKLKQKAQEKEKMAASAEAKSLLSKSKPRIYFLNWKIMKISSRSMESEVKIFLKVYHQMGSLEHCHSRDRTAILLMITVVSFGKVPQPRKYNEG